MLSSTVGPSKSSVASTLLSSATPQSGFAAKSKPIDGWLLRLYLVSGNHRSERIAGFQESVEDSMS
jgi:hypothetical protein